MVITRIDKINEKDFCFEVQENILKRAYESFRVHTYFVLVNAKTVPDNLISDGKSKLSGNCYLGVNYNEIVVIRDIKETLQTILLPLEDIDIRHSVYSIFITYKT